MNTKQIEQITEALENEGFDIESKYFDQVDTQLDQFVNSLEQDYDQFTITYEEPEMNAGYNLERFAEISDSPKSFYINALNLL